MYRSTKFFRPGQLKKIFAFKKQYKINQKMFFDLIINMFFFPKPLFSNYKSSVGMSDIFAGLTCQSLSSVSVI